MEGLQRQIRPDIINPIMIINTPKPMPPTLVPESSIYVIPVVVAFVEFVAVAVVAVEVVVVVVEVVVVYA